MREGRAADLLGKELTDLVLHGRMTLEPWIDGKGWEYEAPEYDDTEASQGTGGSNNWPIEAFGCRYTVNFRDRGWDREKEAREFFQKARQQFGGKELDSIIYGYMQGHAVLQVAHVASRIGAAATEGGAMKWLEYLAARTQLFLSPRNGRVMTCGDRSADSAEPGKWTWFDHFRRLGMGVAMAPKHEQILVARAPIVRAAFARLRGGMSPLDVMRDLGFRTLVPVRVVESDETKTIFRVGSNWHPSTQPVAIAQEQFGRDAWAPRNRGYGSGKNRLHGSPTVTEFPERVEYVSPVYGWQAFNLPLHVNRTVDVEVGGAEIVRDLRAPAPPQPIPRPPESGNNPNPPKKPSWLERMGL